MSGKNNLKFTSAVLALRIILFAILGFYSLMCLAIIFTLITSYNSLKIGATHASWASMWIFVGNGLSAPIFFLIAYCIFKLTYLIAHREPFSPSSPKYVRRIAYAVFSIFFINAIISAISEFAFPGLVISVAIMRFLFKGGEI